MSMLALMYVAVGGAVGSMARYLMTTATAQFTASEFPYGTLTVNILGGLLMGAWIAAAAYAVPEKSRESLHLLFAVGALGGFTTFSAFSFDMFQLVTRGMMWQAAVYVVASVLASLLALVAGMYLVKLLTA
jgi:fluoride exporter